MARNCGTGRHHGRTDINWMSPDSAACKIELLNFRWRLDSVVNAGPGLVLDPSSGGAFGLTCPDSASIIVRRPNLEFPPSCPPTFRCP